MAMNTHLNTKRILIFLTFVIGVSWVVVLAVKQSGMMETNPTGGMMLANYIIITLPALANIFTRLVTKEGWGNLWLRPNFKHGWRFYLTAWLLPLLATIVGGGLFYLLFPQTFDPNLGQVRSAFATIPSLAAQPWLAFLILFVQTMVITMIINGIASMGEEFGWRAYLLQKLMALFAGPDGGAEGGKANPYTGARRAALLVGLIWGVWHYPLFFLGSALTFPFVLIYLVYTCSASVLLSWVALRSGSVWPASIGHGMLNGTSSFPTLMANATANPLLGPGPTGLIGMLGYVILALVLLFNPKAFLVNKEAHSEVVRPVVGVQKI
jgi:membrane protease YdiL (CAAX protease family)